MTDLPGGTVTLLFTDIERSTELLQRLGRERYGEVLRRHRLLIREAASAHAGQEVEMQGDSFLVAFRRARDAVACAAEIQRQLAASELRDVLRVRIGIHTGEPDLTDERLYVGLDVHRAARVMGAAHGGQVLLSEPTRRLAESELPRGLGLRHLGDFHLRSLTQPESISQLIVDGLAPDFPPLCGATPSSPLQRPSRRGRSATAVALAGVGVVALSIYVSTRPDPSPIVGFPNSVAVVDPDNDRVVSVISVGTTPTTIVSGGGAVWTLNTGEQTISRIDASTRQRTRTISAGGVASDIAFADGAVWVADAAADTVTVLDQSGGVETTIPLGIHLTRYSFDSPRVALASGSGRIWATGGDLRTVVIDPATRRVTRRTRGFPGVSADASPVGPDIAAGGAGVWATDGRDELFRLDAVPTETLKLGGFGGDAGILGVAVGDDAVWAAGAGVAWHVAARAARPIRTYEVGAGPAGIALGAGSVWTANAFDGTVSRVDLGSGETRTVLVGGTPSDLVFADGLLWVTIG